MVKIENIKSYNWEHAITGMRNPLESWGKSNSRFGYDFDKTASIEDIANGYVTLYENPKLCKNDYKLAMGLAKAGSDHRKFLRQVMVSVDITAPDYWWREYATYKIGTVENSTSQMHKLGSRPVTVNDFSFDDGVSEELQDQLVSIVNNAMTEWLADKSDKTKWRALIQSVPQSFNYTRTCTLNYEILRNMYNSRKTHKLSEWVNTCAEIIDDLPYPELITGKTE